MPTPRGSPTKSVDSGESNVSAMLDLRNGRKRAEADLQLLSNRLALLRNEESRAMTKITETKNRAKEIMVMKKKNEESNKHRTAKLLGNDDVSRLAKDKVAKAKADRDNKKEATKKLIEENRRRVANSIKEDSKRYARYTSLPLVLCWTSLLHRIIVCTPVNGRTVRVEEESRLTKSPPPLLPIRPPLHPLRHMTRRYEDIASSNKEYAQEQRKARAQEIQRKKDQVRMRTHAHAHVHI